MEILKKIRLKIGESLLKQKASSARRKIIYNGISCVKRIGIVWDASRTDEFNVLSRFLQKMHDRKIEVNIFGYFPGKELPNQYTAIRYLTCIKRAELNIFYLPLTSESEKFIKEKFDVLIDINFSELLPLRYITSLSKASFKVGISDTEKENSPFDLIMDIKKPVRVEEYIDQTVHYLELINSQTDNKQQIN